VVALAIALPLAPSSASAQQPLSDFVAAAHDHAFDLREAIEVREQARSQVDEARARLLPSFTATGAYTHFEYPVEFSLPTGATTTRQITIQPQEQLSATFTLNVPIVDVGTWLQFASSETTADAAAMRAEASSIDVEAQVTQAY
jgi:outer membrane protein